MIQNNVVLLLEKDKLKRNRMSYFSKFAIYAIKLERKGKKYIHKLL